MVGEETSATAPTKLLVRPTSNGVAGTRHIEAHAARAGEGEGGEKAMEEGAHQMICLQGGL